MTPRDAGESVTSRSRNHLVVQGVLPRLHGPELLQGEATRKVPWALMAGTVLCESDTQRIA